MSIYFFPFTRDRTDPALRDREVQRLIDELLGTDDRSFALDDHTIPGRRAGAADDGDDGGGELPVFGAITTALQSPPFMTAARVVVVRDVANLGGEQARWLADWMAAPLDDVHLVLVSGGGRTPAALDKAVKAHAEVVKPEFEATGDVLRHELRDARLKLAPDAAEHVVAHLGDDAARVPELVEVLHATYGDDAVLSTDDVDAYLGETGTADRFALTNTIERGDVAGALEALHRNLTATSAKQPKPLAPMQIMASLEGSYLRLVRLDDPAILTKEDAADALGMKPAAARFRLDAARRLGTEGLRSAVGLLAQAELDLRGASGLDERTVMDVLIARLAALNRRSARR